MKRNKHCIVRTRRTLLATALVSCAMFGAPSALAQSTAATIRGQVLVDSTPASDAQVTATNINTGLTRTVRASNGNYNLAGLPPGTYRVDVTANGQSSSQTVTVQVGQTATLNLGVGGVAETAPTGEATDLDTVTVVAPVLMETKTSEVATYVTQKQIESLPQGTRNFLAFADTVPGMVFTRADNGNTSLRSGGQTASAINVFIDGVGQKSYTLPGGISGQDSSRGNPFPQSAIGEYKVITSNYKAEFDQISSAAIVAVTKSGSNEFHGDFFYDKTTTQWREPTPAEEEEGGEKEKSREEQYGLTLSGPIIQDRLQYFIAYEAKEYNTPKTVELGDSGFYDPSQVPADLLAQIGSTNSPFKQDMYFGKLTWLLDDYNLIDFSAQVRKEDETLRGGGQSLPGYATVNTNDIARYDLHHQYSGERWLSDAHLTYEDTTWSPHPLSSGNGYILTASDLSTPGERNTTGTILRTGASPNNQDKGQKGWGLQEDLTFSGWEGHTVKMGVKFKSVEVNAVERHFANPQFYYDINLSTEQPYRVEFATGDPGTSEGFTTSRNKQLGIYIQDDWEVNDHLLLNLGIRWDYETTPTYEDHVTPAELVENLRNWPNIHQPGVDYDIEDYISDGNNREPDKDNFAPRFGFSYDLNADQRHVIFGGAGRAYDRNLFDYLQVEQNRVSYGRYNFYFTEVDGQCRQQSGCVPWDPAYLEPGALAELAQTVDLPREWFLNNNSLEVPYSDQFSIGMRNMFNMWGHEWLSEVTLAHILSYDGIAFHLGNRRPDGSYFEAPRVWGSPWGFDPPFGRIVLADNMLDTRTNSLMMKLDKPYTRSSGWGMTWAYTYTDAKQNSSIDGWPGHFDYPDTNYTGMLPVKGVAKHRLVGTAIWDAFWGLTLSAKLTLESPKPIVSLNCLPTTLPGDGDCYFDSYWPKRTFGHKQLDLAVTKEIVLDDDLKMRLRADVLNVTNERNWNSFDTWWGADGVPNENFGDHGLGITYPTRMFKLSFGVNW